jgi:hypothetical protein
MKEKVKHLTNPETKGTKKTMTSVFNERNVNGAAKERFRHILKLSCKKKRKA